jgi:hypothetical protein
MQLAVPGAKLLLLEEQGVVHQGEGVEDIKLELLRKDQGIVHQRVQTLFQLCSVGRLLQRYSGGVIEEVGCTDGAVLRVYDGRFDRVEREEVGDFFACGVLRLLVQIFHIEDIGREYLDDICPNNFVT